MAVSTILSVAVSGLNASAAQAQVSANNVVNANTPGFRPARAEATTLVAGRGIDGGAGVQVQVFAGEDEGVDLVAEFTRLIASDAAYKASARLIETAQEIDNALLKSVR